MGGDLGRCLWYYEEWTFGVKGSVLISAFASFRLLRR